MGKYIIRGGRRISGEFIPNGAKNAALPILAASVITDGESILKRCPQISDVKVMKKILLYLGAKAVHDEDVFSVDCSGITCCEIPMDLMSRMRSSVLLAGPLLNRCGRAVISRPGGCAIGDRPIDLHIKSLATLGASVEKTENKIILSAKKLKGTDIMLDYPSVGATENIILAALGAEGTTVIHNAAREPEITDLQNYLVSCGAEVRGAGTSRIVVEGSKPLRGTEYEIMADRIEAGTYLMAAACTGGEICIKDIDPLWLKQCCKFLRFSGCDISKCGKSISLKAPERLYSVGKIKTGPHPGFPTDLQPQFTSIMAGAIGETHVEDSVFVQRYGFIKELLKMGADVEIFRGIAIIKGKEILRGAPVEARDLRGGAALVLAGLMAQGETVICNTEYIERGYCGFPDELGRLGGDIERCI